MFGIRFFGMPMKDSVLLRSILERTSVRDFDSNKKIPKDIKEQILSAGVRAPSAGNIQPRTFIVAEDENVKEKLFELCEDQIFMKHAPLWIVVCADLHRHLKAARLTGVDYDFTGIVPFTFGVLDAALSLENMVIAAEALGLGSVIIGSVIEHPQKVKEILELPEHCLALSIICVGYPKKKQGTREKWDNRIIACRNRYADINVKDVSNYWRKFVSNELNRGKKTVSEAEIDKFCAERSYGKHYSNHYTEKFVKATNKKLMDYLKNQGFLKHQKDSCDC